ncbi:Acetyltransferase (GNAT) family protein [Syntrophus gentianae]|uniref:Acetyltransferase (GNAT) family protein n=1 Tax=Syntrophus gentianae TaxID=43775 RepID=A0A1H8ALR9_9BACT|nr:GNAT family N-acetyltransferase [Syntrophus gentianae]SEM71712.1 Acetyltransferase (GNAT) family protein [Syntrophus gentianae]
MKRVRLSTLNDYSDWLKLAKEVEPLFGSMTEDPIFCNSLRQAILKGNAFCITESANDKSGELFLGGIVISKEANEIVWFAVLQHSRGKKIGTTLLSEVMKQLDYTRPITVTTFDRTIEAGTRARRLYESFGFRDSIGAGPNPAGIPTVTMTLERLNANHGIHESGSLSC